MVMYREFVPQSALQDAVRCFWTLEREHTLDHPTDEIVPDSGVELIFNFGSAYVLDMGGLRRQLPPVYLVGLQDRPMILRSSGVVRLVAARFYAWGLLPFLDIDAAPGSASAVVLDADWQALVERLRAEVLADRYDRAVEQLEAFLLARRQSGQAATGLHSRLRGVSQRRRQPRFEKVRERLMADPDVCLSDLTREFGFADRAQLVDGFRAFSGRTPDDFAAAMRAFRSTLRDHEHVVFLQSPPLPDYAPVA